MISDDSSSDSETGRFKGRKEDNHEKDTRSDSNRNDRSTGIRKPYERNREFDRKRNERNRFDRDIRDSHYYNRRSPQRSRDRSHDYPRRSRERYGHSRDHRPESREKRRPSHSRSVKSPDKVRGSRGRDDRNVEHRSRRRSKSLSPKLSSRKHGGSRERSRVDRSPSEHNKKRSVVYKPDKEEIKKRSPSPIVTSKIVEDVEPGSYYNMKPTLVKEQSPVRSEDTSEIDSSDDVKLRAKLLNLEKELSRTKKKKHKKKHKRNKSKSRKDNDCEIVVSSTTDMQDIEHVDLVKDDVIEVTSTDNYDMKESSEEGEISSDDLSKNSIDPNDLRLKLKRTNKTSAPVSKSKIDVCGPALPPHLQPRKIDIEGPALPPKVQRSARNIGPSIPNDMRKVLAESDRTVVKYESSDDDGIGPLPAGAETKWTDAHQKLEERALDIKIRHLDGHTGQSKDVKTREKWMLELPEGKAKILGLEARSFRAKEGPDMSDRSSWTDTPEQKALKAAGLAPEDTAASIQEEARSRQVAMRDQDQEKAVKKHKKKHKREESLLEMHEKKLKKKKKKEDKESDKKERRPFSRDVDLQVNRFDEAQKKSIIKKAQQLDTRFSRGEAKYL